jgi:LacI family kdg operon repressor/LacI family transcriptional regulator
MNGRTGGMPEATQMRLQAAIEALGYVPNAAARSLKTGRSKLIGVVIANIAHMYWSTMLEGIEEGCRAMGYSMLISSAGNDAETQDRYLQTLLHQNVAGLLLNPVFADDAILAKWAAIRHPVIMLDRTYPALRHPLVAIDNVVGAQLATQHLIDHGHSDIGLISWGIDGLSNRQERLDGFLATLSEHGLTVKPGRIGFARESWDDGVRASREMFSKADAPTAVFCANMDLSLQVLSGLRQLGIRVPDDVSLIGFDDAPWDPLLDPPLSAVAGAPFRLGKLAALRLCRAIEQETPVRPHDSRFRPVLVQRRSVAQPRTGALGVPDS